MVANWKCGALYDSITFFFPSELDSSVFEILPAQSWCRPSAHWKWQWRSWFISPVSPGWFPAQTWSSTHDPTMVLWNISPSPSALLCGTALGRMGMVRNGGEGTQKALGTFLRNFSCAGTAGISGQPQGSFGGLLQGSPVTWSLPGLCHWRSTGCSRGLLGSARAHWAQLWSPAGPGKGWESSVASWHRNGSLQHGLIHQGVEEWGEGGCRVGWCRPCRTGSSKNTSELMSSSNWFQTNGQKCLVVLLQFELQVQVNKEWVKLNFDLIEFWDKINLRI